MKKLIAILLVLACVFALGACNGNTQQPSGGLTPPSTTSAAQDLLDALSEVIRTSTPTQSKVSTVTGSQDVNLKSNLTITMGQLSGKDASLYVYEYESFNELGAKEAKIKNVETKEYVEGMGLRVDVAKGGYWESEQSNFVRRITPYRMSLDATMIKSLLANADGTEVSFVVPLENAADVFTSFDSKTLASMNSDISVKIKTDGTAVTYMEMVYNIKNIPNIENPTVKVVAEYSYDLQSITLLG